MIAHDRVKSAFFGAVNAARPRADYMCAYRGKVVSQSGQAVDVQMEDPRIPGMSGLPLQAGIPGATVEVSAGARVLVAFENGDPARPVALLWDQGAKVSRLSFPADLLELGGEGLNLATDGAVQGQGVDTFTGLPYWMLGSATHAVLVKKL